MPSVIRRILSGVLGLILTVGGFGCVGYWFAAEPDFDGGPKSDVFMATIVFGLVVGGAGIWLIRRSFTSS